MVLTIIYFSLTFLVTFYMRVGEKKVLKRSFIVAVIDKRDMRHYLFFSSKKILSTKTNIYIYVNASLNIFVLISTEVTYMLLYFVWLREKDVLLPSQVYKEIPFVRRTTQLCLLFFFSYVLVRFPSLMEYVQSRLIRQSDVSILEANLWVSTAAFAHRWMKSVRLQPVAKWNYTSPIPIESPIRLCLVPLSHRPNWAITRLDTLLTWMLFMVQTTHYVIAIVLVELNRRRSSVSSTLSRDPDCAGEGTLARPILCISTMDIIWIQSTTKLSTPRFRKNARTHFTIY